MISRSKSLAALAAVLTTVFTFGASVPEAAACGRGCQQQGISLNGQSSGTAKPFDLDNVSVQDVQLPEVVHK